MLRRSSDGAFEIRPAGTTDSAPYGDRLEAARNGNRSTGLASEQMTGRQFLVTASSPWIQDSELGDYPEG